MRNRGEGEYIQRSVGSLRSVNNSSRRVYDLSQLSPHGGWPTLQLQQAFPYGLRPRPASEAGDWCPPLDPYGRSPTQHQSHQRLSLHALEQSRQPQRVASNLSDMSFCRSHAGRPEHMSDVCSVSGMSECSVSGMSDMGRSDIGLSHTAAHSAAQAWRHAVGASAAALPPAHRTTAKFWFDPLYIEDPLRPSNNVGRNCFRIYAIQQEFSKAQQLCAKHELNPESHESPEYPILSRLLRELLPSV